LYARQCRMRYFYFYLLIPTDMGASSIYATTPGAAQIFHPVKLFSGLIKHCSTKIILTILKSFLSQSLSKEVFRGQSVQAYQ
ncbi:MAG TPA: hypothetical protein P5032_09255, partial [Candidatus Competibacter sp.]|nr:hypothetical protein [Candidatus Competibacter sp.]